MAGRPRLIDATLLLLLALLGVLVALAGWRGGEELVGRGFASGGSLLYRYALVLIVSFLAAGFAEVLLPHDWIRDSLGPESGLRGILIASGAGLITPSGPFVSMPIAAVMLRSGAGVGAVVAFVTAWALLALHRLLAWEVPLLGWRFALLRYAVCLAVPILAGLAARVVARAG